MSFQVMLHPVVTDLAPGRPPRWGDPLKTVEIYGFSGKLGSGKNHIAEQIFLPRLPYKPTLVLALGDQVKINCMIKDRVAYDRLYLKKDHESRKLLQKRGTEDGRDQLGDHVWIEYLEAWMRVHQSRGIQRFIITDLRFPNEVEWLKSLGGIAIRVEAPQRNHDQLLLEQAKETPPLGVPESQEPHELIDVHSSETSLDDYPNFDFLIQNDYQYQSSLETQINSITEKILDIVLNRVFESLIT